MSTSDNPVTFSQLGVPAPLVRVLASDGITTAFPIQADTLPDSLAGRDILGRGRTGSGKTLAFCLPLVTRLGESSSDIADIELEAQREVERRRSNRDKRSSAHRSGRLPQPRGLVLAPTRELANQINDVLLPLAQAYGMTTATVYGGVKYSGQVAALNAGADIVIACPGRLEDLLRQNLLTLSAVQVAVLDEADEMADMGFLPPVERLLEQTRPDAQHMLFSATLDHGVDKLVERFLKDPKEHSVDDATSPVDEMTHHVFEITKGEKPEIVRLLASGTAKRILFTRTKFQAMKLAKSLTKQGIPCAQLHGNLNQNQRDRNLAAFENGDVNVLAATDVAARGIDVGGVELVVQVEPPEDPKAFLHRSGRTARAGHTGDVVTLVLPNQRRETRRMLAIAGIKVKAIAVTPKSPEVLELVGETAELVQDWELAPLQPKKRPGATDAKSSSKRRRSKKRNERKAEGQDSFANKTARRERTQDRKANQQENQWEGKASHNDYSFDEASHESGHKSGHDSRRENRRENHREDRYADQQQAQRSDRRSDQRKSRGAEGRIVEEPRGRKGGKRVHHKPIRITEDLRSEDAKRHDRRTQARKHSDFVDSADFAQDKRSKQAKRTKQVKQAKQTKRFKQSDGRTSSSARGGFDRGFQQSHHRRSKSNRAPFRTR
ncbi:DEAD/DEAH box helicase [Bifidobacterium sp. DSM 109957]|uniref:DEAD/DEAH box helicase n=1 Tax=Bifidobacterium oedipodis TaxID=2675322 RepID=A0A7Y0HTW9_9BIFI|nr:DEAD/DEAH box helicase [Bifidobacterium sp. DSM 109957]